MIHLIFLILSWISKYWFPSIPSERALADIRKWVSQVHLWIRCNGIFYSIKRIKMIRLIVTRYICGQPLMVNSQMIGVTSDGFPTSISYLKDLVDSRSPESLRFVLTLLGVSRAISYPAPADYSSVVGEFTGSFKRIDNDFVKSFVSDFLGHFNPLLERPGPSKAFLSLKAGPVGGPAILSASIAAAKFTGVNLWGLAYIGGDKFMSWVKEMKSSVSLNLNHKLGFGIKPKHLEAGVQLGNRRFLHIFDPEAKHRLVACYDYLSQLAFNPFSEWCFDALRKIPRDRTFTQDPVITDKAEGHLYHSFDLSAATDRFPIDLQTQLITEIAGPAFAAAWKNLMVNEPFLADKGGLTSNILDEELYQTPTMIKYKVGQPMGARSSWAVFTLSHHLVVQYAAKLCGLYPFNQYIMLGDDIVIYHDQVAEKYLELISGLGVEISTSKSHRSARVYEFAKRWFQDGIEISPVPLAGLLDNFSNPKLLYSQILDLIYKGRGPRVCIPSPTLLIELLKVLRQVPVKDGWNTSEDHLRMTLNGFSPFKRLFSDRQLVYFHRMAQELNLVFRNLKEFRVEETRAFMASASSTNEYILPSDEATLFQEWIRTSSGVVNGMAMGVIRKLSQFFKNYVNSYETLLISAGCDSVETKIASHPLTYAIYNSVKSYHRMNKEMGYTTDLSKQLETITLIDLEKLARKERTSIELVFTYATVGRKLFYQLRDDPYLVIAKARSMQFGRELFNIELAMAKAYPNLKENL